jgi:hypothetical protein
MIETRSFSAIVEAADGPACERPFFTKMLQLHAFPMRLRWVCKDLAGTPICLPVGERHDHRHGRR